MNTFDKFLYTQAVENLHAGVYKLRLRNESGVFECISNVAIDNPENKLKKLEEQRKKEEEEKKQREEEERRQKEEEERLNYVNKNLSDLKGDGKDEDKDRLANQNTVDPGCRLYVQHS